MCGGGIFAMARRLIDIGASQLLLDPSIVSSGLLKYAHNVRFEHNSKVEAACECFLVTGTEWAVRQILRAVKNLILTVTAKMGLQK